MKIIGVSGLMGSGKSTLIQMLDSMTDTHLVKFAGPLYEMQEMIYDRIQSVYLRDESFVKDRKLLQWLGTEFGRGLSPTLWVDLWKADASETSRYYPDDLIVCDDVRFDNEAETIRSLGGIVVSLNTNKNLERINTNTGIVNHASEAGISKNLIDFTICNNGTLEELEQSVREMYEVYCHTIRHRINLAETIEGK